MADVDGLSTKDQAIELAKESLLDCMINDMYQAYRAGIKLGAVILAACSLDVLGRLYTGGKASKTAGFNEFLTRYIPQYEKLEDPYGKFRSGLVHAYSTTDYAFSENCAEHHCKKIAHGSYLIDVAVLMADVKEAAERYISDLRSDESVLAKFLQASAKSPLIRPQWILLTDLGSPSAEPLESNQIPPRKISGTTS